MLNELVRTVRARSGISQRELAIRSGTSQAAVSRIEAGLEEPSFERFTRLMVAMGWKPTVDLRPLAEHDADPLRLAEQQDLAPAERIDDGLAWIELAQDLVGSARRG